jgi:phosphoribosyl 1,2-cyclic phosphate phosphodiesterase
VKVLFLGTGTSHGVPMIGCECAVCRSTDSRDARTRPSIVVEAPDGTVLLVDTPPDLRTQALAHGLRRLDAILYTHSHADHIAGLDDVRRFNAVNGGPMPLYGDPATVAEIRLRFGYAFDPATFPGGGLPDLRLWAIGGPFCVRGLNVIPVPILHGRRPILGFRFGKFAYLTDCSEIPPASRGLLTGLDVLVLDALRRRPHPTHFSLAEAVAVATEIGAGRTYFTHIAHDLGHADTCAQLPPTMALAYDGLRLELKEWGSEAARP